MRRIALLFILSLAAFAQPSPSPLEPLQFLLGDWTGVTDGQPGHGAGKRHYDFVLRGKFIHGTNETIYPPQAKNPKGEKHQDLGFFSYDSGRKLLVLRQFHVEGFVNQYAQRPGALVFETERIENIPDGWRARESYTVISKDEFEEVFELAEPGKDFELYSKSRWKRVKK